MEKALQLQTKEQKEIIPENFVSGFWGVRYQVRDVERSVEFYTNTLGFKLLAKQYYPR